MLATLAFFAAAQNGHLMDWWHEAKFGMFIHWGVYSVPAGEWQGQKIPGIGEWIYYSAKAKMSDYEKLQQQFDPEKFDAAKIVGTAKAAGMKYIVITSKHHDGFCMFDAAQTDWKITNTPFKRDPLLELSRECTKQGLRMCFYYSIMDWHHPDYSVRRPWDLRPELGEPDMDQYVAYMKAELKELLGGKYGKVGILWFDGEWEQAWTHERGADLYNYVKKLDPDVIVNNRVDKGRGGMGGLSDAGFKGDYGTPEQEIPATGLPGVNWESCMTMNDTWGYKKDDNNWKSTEQLLFNLVDCVSKGGNFLLNVGPSSLGEIPEASVQRLRETGGYVRVNKEAIYGAGPSPFAKLPYRVTTKPGKLYVHLFRAEPGTDIALTGMRNRVIRAYALDDRSTYLEVTKDNDSMKSPLVSLAGIKDNKIMTTVCVEYEGPIDVVVPPLMPGRDGVLTLNAMDASVHGETARIEGRGSDWNVGYWTNKDDYVSWEFELPGGGAYDVELTYASPVEADKARVKVQLKDAWVDYELPATGGWNSYKTIRIGSFTVPAGGKYTLSAHPAELKNGVIMNLRRIVLRPKR